MKPLKTYGFCEDEIRIIRDALSEYYHIVKKAKNKGISKKTKVLYEMFKTDCFK